MSGRLPSGVRDLAELGIGVIHTLLGVGLLCASSGSHDLPKIRPVALGEAAPRIAFVRMSCASPWNDTLSVSAVGFLVRSSASITYASGPIDSAL